MKVIHRPVFGKTDALFLRDPDDHTKVLRVMNPSFDPTSQWTASVKKDGSCGLLMELNGVCGLYCRQDVKTGSRNHQQVMTGQKITVNGLACWATTITRGTDKHERTKPLYVFDVDNDGSPSFKGRHLIGFTPVDPVLDKWISRSVIPNPLDANNPFIWTTEAVFGSLDVSLVKKTIRDTIISEGSKGLLSVEMMGRKICNRYGFTDDQCFVSPHGAEIIPRDQLPAELTYDALKAWLMSSESRWANQEGFVILTEDGKRFKLHRGHFDMEKAWHKQKECGLVFNYAH